MRRAALIRRAAEGTVVFAAVVEICIFFMGPVSTRASSGLSKFINMRLGLVGVRFAAVALVAQVG